MKKRKKSEVGIEGGFHVVFRILNVLAKVAKARISQNSPFSLGFKSLKHVGVFVIYIKMMPSGFTYGCVLLLLLSTVFILVLVTLRSRSNISRCFNMLSHLYKMM